MAEASTEPTGFTVPDASKFMGNGKGNYAALFLASVTPPDASDNILQACGGCPPATPDQVQTESHCHFSERDRVPSQAGATNVVDLRIPPLTHSFDLNRTTHFFSLSIVLFSLLLTSSSATCSR